ncbi:MAG: SHOCT domain-containing protein [Solirubrobacterales bacterium]
MGLIRTVARTAVISGTATAVGNNVSRRQANRWAEQAPPASAPPAAAPAAAPAGGDDTVAKLKELAELKEQGILTEEEFAAQKAKLLG